MPAYNYMCLADCKNPDDESYDLIWEVIHGMMEKPKVVCPLCNGKAQITIRGVEQVWYIKGNCYLDKIGAKRDMDLHTMKKEDPFGEHREAGEADHIIDNLERGGKDLRKNKEIIYTTKEEDPNRDRNAVKLYNPGK